MHNGMKGKDSNDEQIHSTSPLSSSAYRLAEHRMRGLADDTLALPGNVNRLRNLLAKAHPESSASLLAVGWDNCPIVGQRIGQNRKCQEKDARQQLCNQTIQ
jgi:hypothetical protein